MINRSVFLKAYFFPPCDVSAYASRNPMQIAEMATDGIVDCAIAPSALSVLVVI